jgi:predicted DNA-binding transcriptional regulator AlpA
VLPVYVRYTHLEAAGIVGSWTQLLRMIDEEDFPDGVLLSANVRAWRLDTITEWLEARPTARKVIPPDAVHPRTRNKRRDQRAAEEAMP